MKKKIHQYTISPLDAGQRLDKYLSEKHTELTRSHINTLIRNKHVEVNHQFVKSGYSLKSKDNILVTLPEPEPSGINPENLDLDIIYEDNDLLVINKSAGMVVHPGAGNRNGTLVNGLLYHCKNLSGINGVMRPGIVHRLDKNTSGLLVAAKNDKAHLGLSRQFEVKSIKRTYHAIVWGVPPKTEGEINTQISRSRRDRKKMAVSQSRGREAVTHFKVIEKYLFISYLELYLETGRTHQIRVHLKYLNHPVFGDPEYNGRKSQLYRLPAHLQKKGLDLLQCINRQALHARNLEFIHPISQKLLKFEIELPQDMQNLLLKIQALFTEN